MCVLDVQTCVYAAFIVRLQRSIEIFNQTRHPRQIHQPSDPEQTTGEEVGDCPAVTTQVQVVQPEKAEWEGEHVRVIKIRAPEASMTSFHGIVHKI